ncbi:MAG TPA: histidine kinase [Gemmatimonadaceae bacterium]|nr:histidine kinase [Gemmatimonadaceae bacterium]
MSTIPPNATTTSAIEPAADDRRAARSRAIFTISPWVVVAAWTVPALLSTFETVMFARVMGRQTELWRAFLSQAPGWYAWAALTPLIAALAVRFPLARPLRWRAVAVHVGAYLLVALAASAVWAAVGLWLRPGPYGFLDSLRNWFISGLPFTVAVYAAVVGIFYSITDRARLRERERDAARLAQQLSEAQLASLRMQLQPHFLFNSLNAIMALVRDGDGERAVAGLSLLSDVLRATLRAGTSHEVSLAEEVAFTRRYLDIERIRFAERLRVTFDIPPSLLDASVPVFVLQPFVENAIKHGILDRRRGGTIAVAATAADGVLRLSVRDDGAGLAPGWDAPGGVGIANARTRLAHMYGGAAALRVGTGDGGAGVAVEITLPLRRHLAAVSAMMEPVAVPARA